MLKVHGEDSNKLMFYSATSIRDDPVLEFEHEVGCLSRGWFQIEDDDMIAHQFSNVMLQNWMLTDMNACC